MRKDAVRRKKYGEYVTFRAIDIGSYNVAIEIFQISRKNGLKSLDYVDYRMELGRDTYAEGRISNAMVQELCQVLNDYKRIMEEYQVGRLSGLRYQRSAGGKKCPDRSGKNLSEYGYEGGCAQ